MFADDVAIYEPPIVYATVQLGLQRAAEAVLFPEPFADFNTRSLGLRYRDAFTKPPLFDPDKAWFQWDGDRWYTNTIGHGLMGSELYLHARRCHLGWGGAFAFTAIASTAWDYVIEASGVRPSAWDLVYTPLAGLLFGELRYQGIRAAARIEARGWRRAFEIVLDPMGEVGQSLGSPC